MANTTIVGNENLQYYDEKIKQYNATLSRIGMVKPDGDSIQIDTITDKGKISVRDATLTDKGIDIKYTGETDNVVEVDNVTNRIKVNVDDDTVKIDSGNLTATKYIPADSSIDITDYQVKVVPKTLGAIDSDTGVGVRVDDDTIKIDTLNNHIYVTNPITSPEIDDINKVLTVIDEGEYIWKSLPSVPEFKIASAEEDAEGNTIVTINSLKEEEGEIGIGDVPSMQVQFSVPAKAIVDTEMSDTSTNPVQNKVIKKYVDDNIDALDVAGYAQGIKTVDDDKTSIVIAGIQEENGKISRHIDSDIQFDIGTADLSLQINGVEQTLFNANDSVDKSFNVPMASHMNLGVVQGSAVYDSAKHTLEVVIDLADGKMYTKPGIGTITDVRVDDVSVVTGTVAYIPKATDSVLGAVMVDDELNDASRNPAQNRVVKGYIDNQINALDSNKIITTLTTETNKDTLTVVESIVETNGIIDVGTQNKSISVGKGNLNLTYTDETGATVTAVFNANSESDVSLTIPRFKTYIPGDDSIIMLDIPDTLTVAVKVNTSGSVADGDTLPITSDAVARAITDLTVAEFPLYEKSVVDNSYSIYDIGESNGKIFRGFGSQVVVNDGVLTIKDADGVVISNSYTANTLLPNTDVTLPTSSYSGFGLMKTSSEVPTGTPRVYLTYIDPAGQVYAYNSDVDVLLDKANTAVQGVKLNGVELSKDTDNKVDIPEATETSIGLDKKYRGSDPVVIDSNNIISVKYDNATIKSDTTSGLYVEKASTNLGVVKMDPVSGSTSYTTGKAIYIDTDGTIKGNYQPGAGINITDNYITATGGISLKVTPDHTTEPSPSSQIIYLEDTGTGENIYYQWVYFDGVWHNVGTTQVSLLEYDKIQDRIDAINALNSTAIIATRDDATNIVTIKGAVEETAGRITSGGSNIQLSPVATTGSFNDLNNVPNNKLILQTYADDVVLSSTQFIDNNTTIGDTTFAVGNAVMTLTAGTTDTIGTFEANASISKTLNIPRATNSTFGVVKTDDVTISSPDGILKVVNPITTPVEAQTGYVLTVLGDGAYAWLRQSSGITDVKVDGSSVVTDGIANIDLPSADDFQNVQTTIDSADNTIVNVNPLKEVNGLVSVGSDVSKAVQFVIPHAADDAMSDTSTHPILNRTVKAYIDSSIHDNKLSLIYKDTAGVSQTKEFTANSAVDVTANIVDLATDLTYGIVKAGSGVTINTGSISLIWATDADIDAFAW